MFSNRSAIRATRLARKLLIWSAACAVTLAVAVAPVRSRAEASTPSVFAVGPQHIYVYDSQNQPVDVTYTHFVGSDGYDYVTLDGNTFRVILDHQEGHVYNASGDLIGYLAS